MGLFDFFKKKKANDELQGLVSSIIAQVFPNGKQQIIDLANSVNKEMKGKYPLPTIMRSLSYCGSLLVTAKDKSASRIVDMGMMLKPENTYTRNDAVVIYKAVVKTFFENKFGIKDENAFKAFYISLGNVDDGGSDIVGKRMKGGHGTYGFSSSNPIPINGVNKTYSFLDSLLTTKGEPINYKRIGAFSSDITNKIIDGYAITLKSGEKVGTLYFCPYCAVDNPEPPACFILKGQPIKQNTGTATVLSSAIKPAVTNSVGRSVNTNQSSPSPSNIDPKQIPTVISPKGLDQMLGKVKRANLYEEMLEVFSINGITWGKFQPCNIIQKWDVYKEYAEYNKEKKFFEDIKSKDPQLFITKHIIQSFQLGVALYLVKNEYGECIGRWSSEQYNSFVESIKSNKYIMYYDLLLGDPSIANETSQFETCFSSIASKFLEEYKQECITEIDSICRQAYNVGFDYMLIKYGDDFLIPSLVEKDYGDVYLTKNVCNALIRAYQNGSINTETFEYDIAYVSLADEVAKNIHKKFPIVLKSYYKNISSSATAAILAGAEAVIIGNPDNFLNYLSEDKIKELASSKEFYDKYPALKNIDFSQMQCDIVNGSNILNIRDPELLNKRIISLINDGFILGMSVMLNVQRAGLKK